MTVSLLVVRLASGREIEIIGGTLGRREFSKSGILELVLFKPGEYSTSDPIEIGRFKDGADGAVGWYVTDVVKDDREEIEAYRAATEAALGKVSA